jgi:Family of unknown function (DUF5947)
MLSSGEPLFATLRQFVRPRPQGERCELCAAAIAAEHQHLIEPAERRLVCCCDACAVLFSGRQSAKYVRVPRRVALLPDFRLSDARWDDLHLPINLAFFFRSSLAQRVLAVYPSPAGAMESLLPLEAWHDLETDNPILRELEPDVEALLVKRLGPVPDHYRVPIDECYKLVGLLRTHWRGLSGGTEVWEQVGQFFAGLKERAGPAGATHG